MSVSFGEYNQLAPGRTGKVELAAAGASLLSYALAIPGDTIPLSRVPFELERSKSSDGAEVLAYRARVGERTVKVSYTIVPDRYVVRTSGRVDGGTGTGSHGLSVCARDHAVDRHGISRRS